jgi:hypothetical protein
MRPFFQLKIRLLLFRINLIVSNLRLCEQFCIILYRVLGFSRLVFTVFGKKMFYLLTANKCGLNHKKPGLNHKKTWLKPYKTLV